MKPFRTLLFWMHLTAGVCAGIVILVMSFTGAVLALKPQIQNWVDRDIRVVNPQGARMAPFELFNAVKAARPGAVPQSLALDRDPTIAATIGLGREGNVYVNPYTGEILGPPSQRTAAFFQTMTSWHRYMGATGETRNAGRAATGASNLAFLIMGFTGLVLWWPKQFSARYLRPIVWFTRTTTSRARDFNWHNTIGFWCLPAIIVMTVSGVVISYSWGTNLVYRLTGTPIPAGRGAAPEPNAAALAGRGRGTGPGLAARVEGRGATPSDGRGRLGEETSTGQGGRGQQAGPVAPQPEAPAPASPGQGPAIVPDSLNLLFAEAEEHVPTWRQLSMRLPNREDGPVAFTLTDGSQWNAFARSQLTLNAASGEVMQWQPYEQQNLGQKARGWLRFAHTGELGGVTGQSIAGIGSLGGVFLVYTGLSLAFRRLVNWSLWAGLRERSVRGVGREVEQLSRAAVSHVDNP